MGVNEEPGVDWAERASQSGLVGLPDDMERLWTLHRLAYVEDIHQPDEHDCPFCHAPTLKDEQTLIVHRGTSAFVILNLYPYNTGHLLVCPYRHFSTYDEATPEEIAEIGAITQQAMRVLSSAMGCHGFNIGMNQGEVAGAGIAAHLHQHIVPRWRADANFFPIIAKTKSLPKLLGDVRNQLSAAWPIT